MAKGMENQHYEDKYRDPKGGANIKHSRDLKEIIVKGTERKQGGGSWGAGRAKPDQPSQEVLIFILKAVL